MLLYFKFNNFYSFLDEAEISFQLGKQATKSDYDFEIETTQDKLRLNKVMAVLGANGSGKTQLLKALVFIKWFISHSAQSLSPTEKIYFEPFFQSEDLTEIEMGFLVTDEKHKQQEYRYELELTNKKVHREALYKKTSSSFSYVFERILDDTFNYKHKNFISHALADDANKNVSLISYAHLLDNNIANSIVKSLEKFVANIYSWGRLNSTDLDLSEVSEILNTNKELKEQAEKLLCEFDTGISELKFKKIWASYSNNQQGEVLMPVGVHKFGDKEFELFFMHESNGTQSAFALLGYILPILHGGGIAVLDELDNDLHPHLLPVILDLFRSKHSNPHNAQLIFSCHTPEVFNILNKHQIYLVEKYQQQSEAWRLDEVEGVRNDDNLYAKYMAGAFDAVPNL